MSNSWWKPLCAKWGTRKASKGFLFAVILLLGAGVKQGESEFVYKKSGRDPFWPLVTKDGKLIQGFGEVSIENIHLEGIVLDPEGESIAMISGFILREGDPIGDFKILRIESGRVLLQRGDEKRSLLLEEKF